MVNTREDCQKTEASGSDDLLFTPTGLGNSILNQESFFPKLANSGSNLKLNERENWCLEVLVKVWIAFLSEKYRTIYYFPRLCIPLATHCLSPLSLSFKNLSQNVLENWGTFSFLLYTACSFFPLIFSALSSAFYIFYPAKSLIATFAWFQTSSFSCEIGSSCSFLRSILLLIFTFPFLTANPQSYVQ